MLSVFVFLPLGVFAIPLDRWLQPAQHLLTLGEELTVGIEVVA
jgi:hypothetical protein